MLNGAFQGTINVYKSNCIQTKCDSFGQQGNIMCHERLTAFSVLLTERKFANTVTNFNEN